MDFYKLDESLEFGRILQEMLWIWKWEDYSDFIRKYSYQTGDIDNQSKLMSVFLHYDGLGVQARQGMLSLENIYSLYSTRLIPLWDKYTSIISEFRNMSNTPQLYEDFEWLVNELKNIQKKKGHGFVLDEVDTIISTQAKET